MVRKYKTNCTQRPGCTCNSARCKWLKAERKRYSIAEALIMLSKQKQLKIRYRMNGNLFGCVSVDTTTTSRFPTGLCLQVPVNRFLTIVNCTYGHPKGRATTGRMSYDVSMCMCCCCCFVSVFHDK